MSVIVVLLATAFGAAGTLKLLAPARGPTLASRFADRGSVHALAVAILPWFELTLAEALLIPILRQVAAIMCLISLVVFTAVLVLSRQNEEELPCGCFGTTNGGPSWWPYVLNSCLGALAFAIAVGGEPRGEPEVLALIVVACVGVMTSGVLARELRQQAVAPTVIMDGQPARENEKTIHDQVLATTDGRSTSINRWLSTSRTHIIVFVDPLCGPCRSLLPEVASRQQTSGAVGVATISRGPLSENEAMAREFGLAPVAIVPDDSMARRLGINATPSAILITAEGHIVQPPAVGKTAILALFSRAEANHSSNN
jgi:hypothetical protein